MRQSVGLEGNGRHHELKLDEDNATLASLSMYGRRDFFYDKAKKKKNTHNQKEGNRARGEREGRVEFSLPPSLQRGRSAWVHKLQAQKLSEQCCLATCS